MVHDCYELILNHITYGEFVPPYKENFEEHKKIAYLFLNHKGKYLFEEDILKEYNEGMTIDKLFDQEKHRFVPGANHERNGKREKTWYDIWSMEEIERKDDFFDYFFICKLRHLDLLRVDEFLAFQLGFSFENKKEEYFRFLNISLRKYQSNLLNPDIIETVKEWIKMREGDSALEVLSGNEKEEKIKGRKLREPGDKLTKLSQNQTAILIQFMQKAGIILKDDQLNYAQAGKAFSILTGYSANTLRMQLGTKGEIAGVKHEDYKELHEIVTQMAKLIEAGK